MKITRLLLLIITMMAASAVKSQELETLDPANSHHILWSSCTGSTGMDKTNDLITDNDGSLYVTGMIPQTNSSLWPLINSYNGGNYDAYLNKMSLDGEIIWSMFIGGDGDESGTSLVVDGDGNIIIAGQTSSVNNFSFNSPSTYNGGATDGFIAKITPDGTMLWNHYFGGDGDETIKKITTGPEGRIVICGSTGSGTLSFANGVQQNYGGGLSDGFVLSLNALVQLEWFTYLGGNGKDEVRDVTLDAAGNTYLCGSGLQIPSINTFSAYPAGGGSKDGIIASMDASGNMLWAEYVGGGGNDELTALQMTTTGNIVITGHSDSGTLVQFSNNNNAQPGNQEALILSYTTLGTINWGQYFGGQNIDDATDVQIDFFDNIYVTGDTHSNDLIVIDSFQSINRGGTDNFLIKFNDAGAKIWSSYAGGTGDDFSSHLTTDRKGKIYIAGSGNSMDLSMVLPGNEYASSGDGYIMKISDCNNPDTEIHTPDATVFCDGEQAILIACGALHYEWINGDTTVVSFADSAKSYYVDGFNHVGCNSRSNPMKFEVLETPTITATAGGPTTFCGEGSVTLYAVGCDSIKWNTGVNGHEILADTNRVFIAVGVAENGCRATSDPIEIVFVDLPVIAMAIVEDTVCISAAPVPMIAIPEGGTFIGQGTENSGLFNPFTAGGGQHDLYYSYTDEYGCTGMSTAVSVYVMSYPTVIFDAVDTMCVFDPAIQLFGSPEGGVFEGDGVVGSTFTPAQSGNGPQNIIYSYVDSNGCTNIDNHVIQVESCTKVENINPELISFYPNPANDLIHVQYQKDGLSNGTIYNMSGEIVHTFKVSGPTAVNTSELPAGIYQLVITNNTDIQSKKFTVIH